MAIFNSYVKLPEGNGHFGRLLHILPAQVQRQVLFPTLQVRPKRRVAAMAFGLFLAMFGGNGHQSIYRAVYNVCIYIYKHTYITSYTYIYIYIYIHRVMYSRSAPT